jgi:hypothetical protein
LLFRVRNSSSADADFSGRVCPAPGRDSNKCQPGALAKGYGCTAVPGNVASVQEEFPVFDCMESLSLAWQWQREASPRPLAQEWLGTCTARWR